MLNELYLFAWFLDNTDKKRERNRGIKEKYSRKFKLTAKSAR